MATGHGNWQDLAPVKGLKLGVAKAAIKSSDRNDIAVMVLHEGARVAGVLTQNAYAAAPVHLCRKHMQTSGMRALVVNSGNANACTGERGMQDALQTCEQVAGILGCDTDKVLPFSTGVIGEYLPMEKITGALPQAIASAEEDNWRAFAEAIMTTDTRPKGATETIEWQGECIHISGVAKGSGMINPNMATMLAYVATDAAIAEPLLKRLSQSAADVSFNRITIDGDTSTNDACMLIATGASGAPEVTSEAHPLCKLLADALVRVYQNLARQVVEDGEGATKFVTIQVEGGRNTEECKAIAYSIAHSPLVKTAMFASDPNWGRIVMAIGKAPVEALEASKISVWLDDVALVEKGGKATQYTEADGQRVYDQEAFTIRVDLGRGEASEEVWTTDLSHEYVRINAEYRT